MTQLNEFTVRRVLGAAAPDGGEQIALAVEAEGGDRLTLKCAYGLLPQLMDMFRTAGALATRARQGRSGPVFDVIQPYVSTAAPRLTPTVEGPLLLRFITTEGIPVTFALPRPAVRDLALALEEELTKPPPNLPRH